MSETLAAAKAGEDKVVGIQLHRVTGTGTVSSLACALPAREADPPDAPALALFLAAPERRSRAPETLLMELFGLTPTEARVAGALANGYAVAMPSYTLCPEVLISGITTEIAAAIECAAGMVGGPIRLAGHSAGGHLVTRMICTDTKLSAATLERIGPVLSISGVHDLRPLIRTAMNDDLKLSEQEATTESPALLAPLEGSRVTCWVGGDELPEFKRQNDLLANIWTGLGAGMRVVHEAGMHHFSVVDSLAEQHSALTQAWVLD